MILKLTIDLIPKSAWNESLYRRYKKANKNKEWKSIKEDLFNKEGKICWICGSKEMHLEAHESWDYNEAIETQKLVSIHHLCGKCHKIKHFCLWTIAQPDKLSEQGLTEDDLIKHFCLVNNCNKKDFVIHKEESLGTWRKHNKIHWKQDFSYIERPTPFRKEL